MKTEINKTQTIALSVLRVLIGWHFLYEGMVKVVNPQWSAYSFLNGSAGPFSGFFQLLASNDTVLQTVDLLNEWGLVLIGFSLIVGLFSKWSALAGIFLLGFYYLSHPPFIGIPASNVEGNYLIVNENLIEIAALWVLYLFQTQKVYGLERIIKIDL